MKRRSRARAAQPGKQYESIVANIHKQFAGTATVTDNEMIVGRSGQLRQVDVAIRSKVAGYDVLIVVECKDYHRKVTVQHVDELIGKVQDLGAAKGILVSDSGFTSGAIQRAQASDTVQLVSVIDTSNPKLRSLIGLPVQITFHDVERPFQVTFRRTRRPGESLTPQQETRESPVRLVSQVTNVEIKVFLTHFYKWCNDNAGTLTAGPHTFSCVIHESATETLIGECCCVKTVRCYVNENLLARGAGIYDHVTRKIVAGDDLRAIHLDFNEIRTTWREVPVGYVLDRCKTFYHDVGKLRLESLDEPGGYQIVQDGVVAA